MTHKQRLDEAKAQLRGICPDCGEEVEYFISGTGPIGSSNQERVWDCDECGAGWSEESIAQNLLDIGYTTTRVKEILDGRGKK